MKFTCNQKTLSLALNTVSKAINPRTTIPLLKGILLSAKENYLTLTSSNLDLSIEKKIDSTVEEEGSIVISAKLFMDIIKKLPPGEIKFTLEQEKLVISNGNSLVTIMGQSSSEYPSIGELENITRQIYFDREILKEMIVKTGFSASIDESQGIIVGVLLEMGENQMNMVALDGFRVAIARKEMDIDFKENIIISSKIINEMNKILSEEIEDTVSLTIGEKKAVMILENTKMTMRLMSGEFIKYKDILPKESKTKIMVDRLTLLESIERASLLAKEGKNNLIKCTIEENQFLIESQSEEGDIKEKILCKKEGEDLCIGFNSKYIMDALRVIEDDEIILWMETSISPCLIKPLKGNEYEYLILPVRIPNMQ